MKSLNIYFTGKEQVELKSEDVREPGPGEILIRSRRSLISTGTELTCYSRRFDPGTHWDSWVKYPFTPGYSNVGEVVAMGTGVEGIRVGDRVATRTGHHQYSVRPAAHGLLIPDGVSDEDAAWFAIASIVQNGVRRAEHRLGEVIVVTGLGILGQLVVQYARLSGASEVVAIDLSESRLQKASAHGATRTLLMPVDQARAEVERLTEGRGADCAYDVTGHAPVFSHVLRLVRTFGKVILLGDSGAPAQQHLSPDLIRRGLQVIGAHDGNAPSSATDHAWWTHANMQRLFFQYVERGQMCVSDLVTARYHPEEAAKAYSELLRDRSQALGVLFDWSQLN